MLSSAYNVIFCCNCRWLGDVQRVTSTAVGWKSDAMPMYLTYSKHN